MEVSATHRLYGDQCWDFCPQESHPIGVEDLVLGLKEHENSHTLTTTTTTTTGSKSSQQEVNIRLMIRINALCPQRSLLLKLLVLDEVKCKTLTQQQNQLMTISQNVGDQQVQLKTAETG